MCLTYSIIETYLYIYIETAPSPRKSPAKISPRKSRTKKSPRKSPKKKKIFFCSNEVQALVEAMKIHKNAGVFEPDGLWQTIERSEACQKLKLTKKYTKFQLCSKVKKLAKANK